MFPLNISYLNNIELLGSIDYNLMYYAEMRCDAMYRSYQTLTFLSRKHNYDDTVATHNQVKYRR